MSDPAKPAPTPAATLILLRDGAAGLEVLMLERHARVDFMPGAMVFPGGKLDDADADPGLLSRCRGVGDLDPAGRAARVAAIREAFEECGLLLARPRGGEALLAGPALRGVAQRHRVALHAGDIGLEALLQAEDLELAADRLVPFAHWITPVVVPRRFDTHFFAAEAPPDQTATHDGSESVDSMWIRPEQALAEEAAGRLTIILPTLLNLRRLAASARVADALEAARRAPVVPVLPRVERRDSGPVVTIPADAGYGRVELPVSALQGRPPQAP